LGYYVSNMFGLRTGGVFGGKVDIDALKRRVAGVVLKMRASGEPPDLGDKDGDVSHCMSQELEAHKGTYVVLAGVFNYWTYPSSSLFAKNLSEEFGSEVMHMCWDEERNEVQCQVWLAGRPLFEVAENPIGRILRRVT
jgi:hypothetical protein